MNKTLRSSRKRMKGRRRQRHAQTSVFMFGERGQIKPNRALRRRVAANARRSGSEA